VRKFSAFDLGKSGRASVKSSFAEEMGFRAVEQFWGRTDSPA
jgi:hypothetical protein